jgi:hypothetical protein
VKRSSRGRLPRSLWILGRQLVRVTTVSGSPAQRRLTVAILGGPSAEANGQNGTLDPYQ